MVTLERATAPRPAAVLLLVLTLFPTVGAENRILASEVMKIDLEQAIALALEQNLTRSLQELGPASGQLAVRGAKARFALEVTPVVARERLDDGEEVIEYGANARRLFRSGARVNAGASRLEGSGPATFETWSIEVSQPLLRRFGRLVNEEPLVQANQALDAAERSLLEQESDLILDVVITYLDVLRLRQQERADRKAADRVELLSRVTEAKEKLGRATRLDSLRVGLELGQVEARLQNSTEQLEFARKDLAVLLGASPETSFELAPVARLELDLPPVDQALGIALGNRLDYAQALQDLSDSGRGVRIARRAILPDLSAFARYEDDSDPVGTTVDDNAELLLGLRLSGDVFRRESRIGLSQTELGQAAEMRRVEIVRQSISRDVQKTWIAYRRAGSQLGILERNVEHAEARLELADRLFRMGRGDNFSVIDAEEAFVRAQSELLSGESAVTVSAYRLMQSLGTLVDVPARLKPGRSTI